MEIDEKKVKNQLFLLELFIKEIRDKYIDQIKQVDYEKIIELADDKEKIENNNGNKYDILQDLGKSILKITDNVVNAKQFNYTQVVNFSKAKRVPIRTVNDITTELEIHLKDIHRKNVGESIQLADKVSRMIRINSFPNFDDINESNLTEREKKKRRFFHRGRE